MKSCLGSCRMHALSQAAKADAVRGIPVIMDISPKLSPAPSLINSTGGASGSSEDRV